MNFRQEPQDMPRSPGAGVEQGRSHSEGAERSVGGHTALALWDAAHAYALSAGMDDPEAFADDYAGLIEDLLRGPRYPDTPLPTPAEHVAY